MAWASLRTTKTPQGEMMSEALLFLRQEEAEYAEVHARVETKI